MTINVKSELSKDELTTVYYFIKQFFINLLRLTSPTELQRYVDTNKAVNLFLYIDYLPQDIKNKIQELVRNNPEIIKSYITTKQLTDYAKESLPEIYKILNTIKGQAWLKRFTLFIHKVLTQL